MSHHRHQDMLEVLDRLSDDLANTNWDALRDERFREGPVLTSPSEHEEAEE